MPSPERFPHARRRRRVPARLLLGGAATALVMMLVIPIAAGIGPGGQTTPGRQAVAGQEPTPRGSSVPSAASPAVPPSASPVVLAAGGEPSTPAGQPPAGRATVSHGVPPERAWVEWTGTRAPALENLTGYRWPLAHPRLTLPFGPTPWGSRFVNGEPFHDGVDLATFCSDKVLAAHSGTVLAAGRHYDEMMGWVGDLEPYYDRLDRKHLWFQLPIVIVIDDGNGYRSVYAHMWKINVKKGDRVKAGQVLGLEGMTGRASGCHLHYGLFSPWETGTFRMRPDVVKRMKVPKQQIARVDPLLVLPPRAGINAPAKPKASSGAGSAPTAEP